MKKYGIALFLGCILFSSCEKNMVSKIPHISLLAFAPLDSMRANYDTAAIKFSFTDGNADIGNDPVSVIHIKDSRFDTLGYAKYPFPEIDASVEDPKKGLKGICLFFPDPQPTPRLDSVHQTAGDTLFYEFYITDRAGNESNHIITPTFIVTN